MRVPSAPYHGGAAKRPAAAAAVEPRSCEIRISWVGGGPLVIRGRLAWLLKKLATEGGAQLAEDLDRLDNGHLSVDWSAPGTVTVKTQRTYKWPASAT
ncbi:MAG TPA: hypothetical protein VNM48_08875 [Chloroflexota bacterium]|nr:hypothetical protein [Chloroflexota bacterium]